MQLIDLCSGIGGFSLAAHWLGWETIAFCERDAFCQKVLAKNFPNVPIYDDVFTFPSESFRGRSDVLTAGFPCQPFSAAGKRLGRDDERHLFPQILNIVDAVRPTICVFENVRGLLSIESGRVYAEIITSLEGIGYEVITFCIPASALGAPHRRDRLWIVAHTLDSEHRADGRQESEADGISSECRSQGQPGRTSRATGDAPDARCEYEPRDSEGMETDTSKRTASDLYPERCSESGADEKRSSRNDAMRLRESEHGGSADKPELSNSQRIPVRLRRPPDAPDAEHSGGLWRHRHNTSPHSEYGDINSIVANAHSERLEGRIGATISSESHRGEGQQWHENWPEVAARLCGVDDEFSNKLDEPRMPNGRDNRVNRLKALGNAIVPAIAYEIFSVIQQTKDENL